MPDARDSRPPAPRVVVSHTGPGQLEGAVARAFAAVPLGGTAEQVVGACVAVVRELVGGPVRISAPALPVPLVAGDAPAGLAPALRFPAPDGGGELWLAEGIELGPELQGALTEHLTRAWRAQEERAAQAAELDQLRFHLAALQ
ncbi:MAG TPA: hypothetical protein VK399_18655, partial [Longimicrobiaceae bacterium]|nr:hypothetical protein [Longimicrobiaceae bacterium]